jgi:hypothetical protein
VSVIAERMNRTIMRWVEKGGMRRAGEVCKTSSGWTLVFAGHESRISMAMCTPLLHSHAAALAVMVRMKHVSTNELLPGHSLAPGQHRV